MNVVSNEWSQINRLKWSQ